MTLLLASVHGAAGAGEKAGLVALALLCGLAVLLRPRTRAAVRLRALAMLATLLATPVLLAIDVWGTTPVRHLRAHGALLAVGVVLGFILLAGVAALFAHWRSILPLAAIFMLPFRVPITLGGTTANLLVPLYVVIAAGVLAQQVPRLLWPGGRAARVQPPDHGDGAAAAMELNADRSLSAAEDHPAGYGLRALLCAFVVLYAIQAAYSVDFSKALQNVVFFYVPFSLLLSLLLGVRWSSSLLSRALALSVGLGVLFALVGFVEYGTKSLLLNKALVASNVYGNYFRVNSLFYDPNIYGRYLALVMLLLATVAMFAMERRLLALCAVGLAVLWLGLLISISETSIVALLAGLAVLGGARWGARRALGIAVGIGAVGLVLFFAGPASLHFGVNGKGGSLNTATSGRAKLISGGLHLFEDRPLAGFGSGSFASQYRRHQPPGLASTTSDSHTIPVTIAAEQGIVGLLVYVALVLCCLFVLFSAAGRSPPRIAIATCFVALLVHTFAYADFLEDPITWALIAIGISLAAAQRSSAAGAPVASHQALQLPSPAAGEQQPSPAG